MQQSTSAASWELRRQGRYDEAWQLLVSAAMRGDEKAKAELWLCYHNSIYLAEGIAPPDYTTLLIVIETTPAHLLFRQGQNCTQHDMLGCIAFMKQAMDVWHHPRAAAFLSRHFTGKERVRCLEIGARQRHILCALQLANMYFDGDTVQENWQEGARLLMLLGTPANAKLVTFVRKRFDETSSKGYVSDERIREFYIYGKSNNSFVKDAFNLLRYTPNPRAIYLKAHESCRSAVLYVMWSFRREFQWPRDLCRMLAKMLWNKREEDADVWYDPSAAREDPHHVLLGWRREKDGP